MPTWSWFLARALMGVLVGLTAEPSAAAAVEFVAGGASKCAALITTESCPPAHGRGRSMSARAEPWTVSSITAQRWNAPTSFVVAVVSSQTDSQAAQNSAQAYCVAGGSLSRADICPETHVPRSSRTAVIPRFAEAILQHGSNLRRGNWPRHNIRNAGGDQCIGVKFTS